MSNTPAKKTRGPAKPIGEKLANGLDRTLAAILREDGEPLVDSVGNVQLDGDGKVVRKRINAATLNVIRARVKDLGINRGRKSEDSTDLVAEAARRGLKINGRPVKMPPQETRADGG